MLSGETQISLPQILGTVVMNMTMGGVKMHSHPCHLQDSYM